MDKNNRNSDRSKTHKETHASFREELKESFGEELEAYYNKPFEELSAEEIAAYISRPMSYEEAFGMSREEYDRKVALEEWKRHPFRSMMESWKRQPRLFKLFTMIIFLTVIWTIAGNIARGIRLNKAMEESGMTLDLMGLSVPSEEDYLDYLKSEESDIEGMSKYEKREMGLDPSDGSDTDMDGLTDREEIEVYGTDPLLASTAGDLYKDGYKIENGMDPFTYYEYEGSIEFINNECSEVILSADIPSDLNAVVKDYTDAYSLSKFGIETIYAGYWLYNYSGRISLDLADVFFDTGIHDKDLQVMVAEGSFVEYGLTEFKKCSFERTGSVLAVDYEFDKDGQYYVYVTNKATIINGIATSVRDSVGTATDALLGYEESDTTGKALIHGSILLYGLTKRGLTIEYTELATEEETELFLEQVIQYYGGGSNFLEETFEDLKGKDSKVLKSVSSAELDFKYKVLQRILPWFELIDLKGPKEGWFKLGIFCYTPFTCDVAELKEGEETASDFDKMVDELSFGNFGSYISAGGNCAGISHLTSYLYNTKSFPETGSYTCTVDGTQKEIAWDLTTDKENATLMNLGLADYKDSSFVSSHSSNGNAVVDTGLSSGEEEFVNMIGCLWAEGNAANDLSQYVKQGGEKNRYKIVKKAKKYIDKGKVLDVYLYFYGLRGHAVNIYDYKEISEDEIWFYVYDSNIPQDNGYLASDACYLKVKKIVRDDGTSYFDYLYWPLGKNSPRYLASSYEQLMPTSMIVIMDENWKVFK